MKLAKWKLSEVKKVKLCEVKGNPNFQGILNWIIETLYYYCRKQHKNIKTHRLLNKMLFCLCALLSAYCDLRFLPLPQRHSFFSSWTEHSTKLCRILNITSDHVAPHIVSSSGLKMVFSKLSLVKYHCLHTKTAFTVTSIYFISYPQLLQNIFTNLLLL